jgi:Putative polyhydroxyalkanoic acid system protein (PHA_gran_rgn)
MAQITVREPHTLGTDEARRRIDASAQQLAGGTFPGVEIKDLETRWNGSTLETSFQARKGFFSKRISGSMQVENDAVTLQIEVPDLVFSFVPRPQVEGFLREKLREKLA